MTQKMSIKICKPDDCPVQMYTYKFINKSLISIDQMIKYHIRVTAMYLGSFVRDKMNPTEYESSLMQMSSI